MALCLLWKGWIIQTCRQLFTVRGTVANLRKNSHTPTCHVLYKQLKATAASIFRKSCVYTHYFSKSSKCDVEIGKALI